MTPSSSFLGTTQRGHVVGGVGVMVQPNELLASFEGLKSTGRGKQIDRIGEVVQRERKMVGEIGSNN